MQWSGQAADRDDITRQAGSKSQAANGQSRENSPGNNREIHLGGNARKCQTGLNKTSQCVHGSVLLICVCE